MAMSIDYLRQIPQLDIAFGRGYGEEVDWCQKARALGGRHLGLANLFVEHRGGTSFGSAEKQRLIARNGAVVSRRYPHFDADVQCFIADDPLAASRLALAVAWAASRAKGAIPLYLAHNMGGGAEDYLSQRIAGDLPDAALVLRVGTGFRWQLEVHSSLGVTCGGTDDFTLIQHMLDPVKNLHIIYSCGVGDQNPADLPHRLLALCRGPADQIDILFHDYFPISPSYTLLNSAGRYLGLPDPNTDDTAHYAHKSTGTALPLADWQAAWGKLIVAANNITVFSQSSAQLVANAYPASRQKLRVIPHQALADLPRISLAARGRSPVIGVLGNIGYHKGAGVLQTLSERLAQTGLSKLVVLGRVDPKYPLHPSAQIHGGYQRTDIPALVARYGITDWLIPRSGQRRFPIPPTKPSPRACLYGALILARRPMRYGAVVKAGFSQFRMASLIWMPFWLPLGILNPKAPPHDANLCRHPDSVCARDRGFAQARWRFCHQHAPPFGDRGTSQPEMDCVRAFC